MDPNNPAASGMVLTFDDEFNGLSVSDDGNAHHTVWTNHLWYVQPPADPLGPFKLAHGVLTIDGLDGGGGLISMNAAGQGFTQKFGYFEARMWFPSGSGTWPAFWMMSADHALRHSPATELDIVEGQGVVPNGYFGTLHRDSSNEVYADASNRQNWMPAPAGVSLDGGWHRYGALWDPADADVTFYLDGHPIGTASKFPDTDTAPMFLVIANTVGDIFGRNKGTPPAPDLLQVDYVRVFQFPSENPVPVAPQPVSSPDGGGQFPPGYGATQATMQYHANPDATWLSICGILDADAALVLLEAGLPQPGEAGDALDGTVLEPSALSADIAAHHDGWLLHS